MRLIVKEHLIYYDTSINTNWEMPTTWVNNNTYEQLSNPVVSILFTGLKLARALLALLRYIWYPPVPKLRNFIYVRKIVYVTVREHRLKPGMRRLARSI